MATGHVWWFVCLSPRGLGDIVVLEKNGRPACVDFTSTTSERKATRKRKATLKATRKTQAIAAERARRQREEEIAWEREQQRSEAENRRRSAETWRQIGRTLGTAVRDSTRNRTGNQGGYRRSDCVDTRWRACSTGP